MLNRTTIALLFAAVCVALLNDPARAQTPVMDLGALAINMQHLKLDKKSNSELSKILNNYQTMNATLGAPGRPTAVPADFLGQQSATSPLSALQSALPSSIAVSQSGALNSAAAIGRREYASALTAAVSGQLLAAKAKPDAAAIKASLSALGLGDLASNQAVVDSLTTAVSGNTGLANLQPLRDFLARVPQPAASRTLNANGTTSSLAAGAAADGSVKTFPDLRNAAKSRFYAPNRSTLTPSDEQDFQTTRLIAQRAAITDALATAVSAQTTAEMSSGDRHKMLSSKITSSPTLRGDIQANTASTLAAVKAYSRLDAASALLLHISAGGNLIKDIEIAPAMTANQ